MTTVNEAIDNVAKVIEDKDGIEIEGVVNLATAEAYAQSKKVDKHLQEVKDELDEKAKAVITENPGTGTEIKNVYTAKLTLDESLVDFSVKEAVTPKKSDGRAHRMDAFDENEGNRYLDYDMFTFIHELFAGQHCNTNPAPITPMIYGPMDSPEEVKRKAKVKKLRVAGKEPKPEDLVPFPPVWGMRKMRKYLDAAVDDYNDNMDARKARVPQVASDGSSTITISARKRLDLHDVVEACRMYHLECSDIRPYKNAYWDFFVDITVPELAPGYPMMLDDFLADHDMEMDEIMPEDFCRGYQKALSKNNASMDEVANDLKVKDIFDEVVTLAATDGDTPLKVYKRELINRLKEAGLKFNAKKIRDAFDAEFDYEWDNEEDSEID